MMGQRLPLYLALGGLLLGGVFLLNRADAEARDTIRKHHLEDLEQSLYFARNIHGTFPPYDQASWCGVLTDPNNKAVLAQIEEILRAQNEKYANPAKPFPTDPAPRSRHGQDFAGYFYWKRNPAIFEFYSMLETAPTGERSTAECDNSELTYYDYGITSLWRQNQ
ncbi:MAG: hypothetical protein ABIH36_04430 [bacterium]